MDTRILLEGHRNKVSSNTSEGLNVELKGKRKILPSDGFAEVISQYDQYMEEREACNVIRLTCQVNPICSNILFNRITEVVKDEGSSNVSFINYKINGLEDKDDEKLFDGISYKKKSMEFWSSDEMMYKQAENLSDAKIQIATAITNVSSDYMSNTGSVGNATSVKITNSIRDTQLSNTTTNFVYHCGLDIFNNHLIRSNTFKTVCKMYKDFVASAYTDDYGAFNTIADLMRDVSGDKVVEKIYFPITAGVLDHTKLVALHLYGNDDIYSFDEAVKNRLIANYEGWVGFENRSKIKSYFNFKDDEELEIERPLMYLNGGDFVDMYPGRDLYSFLPKYNTFKHRIEKNWNYCLTYPSSSYTPSDENDDFSDIIECTDGLNSLKAIYFDENTKADNGVSQLVIYGIAKHGLSVGDYVNIYVTNDGKNDKVLDTAEVTNVVDDFIFTVNNSSTMISSKWVYVPKDDIISGQTEVDGKTYFLDAESRKYFYEDITSGERYYLINDKYVNFDENAQKVSFKKVVGDIECDYYVRIFSKIPNFKNASADTSSEYEIYKDENLISEYQNKEYDFESHVSRLAFAKNIYSDNIGEIVFTDDIDISHLHDNLGRPLTSIYITFTKNNKGYKEWYGFNYKNNDWDETDISGETIEFSHAFGKVTCGIKTSEESSVSKDINGINVINNNTGYTVESINEEDRSYTINDGAKTINIDKNEVWFDFDKHYYGDLCYYDNYNAVERHIEYINHRFNTGQRESSDSLSNNKGYFMKFNYDKIKYDDYDTKNFEISMAEPEYECNDKKEGYYYNPHYEIPIKTFGKLRTIFPDFLTIREFKKDASKNNVYQFTTLEQHFLGVGDKAILYDTIQDKYYNLVTISGDGDNYRVFTCMVYDEKTNEEARMGITYLVGDVENTLDRFNSAVASTLDMSLRDYRLFKMDNLDAPSYCRVLKDGTCRVIWRDVLNNGFNKDDDTVEEYPFTNGAFYINKKVDIYVRRQDPYGIFRLFSEEETYLTGEATDISNEDNYVKDDEIEC